MKFIMTCFIAVYFAAIKLVIALVGFNDVFITWPYIDSRGVLNEQIWFP